MCTSKPDIENYKKMYGNFYNISILTKSSKPGEVQLTFMHTSVRKNPSGNLLQRLTWKYQLTRLLSFRSLLTLTLTWTATKYAS